MPGWKSMRAGASAHEDQAAERSPNGEGNDKLVGGRRCNLQGASNIEQHLGSTMHGWQTKPWGQAT